MEGICVHILNFENGHVLNSDPERAHDCWCEPTGYHWMTDNAGNLVFVVEHNDYTAMHRRLQLAERREGRSPHAWIDTLLARIGNPPLLPPHKESSDG
jgi:hypothetical protein